MTLADIQQLRADKPRVTEYSEDMTYAAWSRANPTRAGELVLRFVDQHRQEIATRVDEHMSGVSVFMGQELINEFVLWINRVEFWRMRD